MSCLIGFVFLALGVLTGAGEVQAAALKSAPAPAKAVRKPVAQKPAARKPAVRKPAVRKPVVRKRAVKRRAPVRRVTATPTKPNPLLAGVVPLSPLLAPQFPPLAPPPPISGTCFSCADPLLATAYSLLGVRYRLGGASPQYGFDCSGFTMYTYKTTLNVPLPSSAPAQFQVGIPVDKRELVPGDLVFFRPYKRGWHVGMYVGDDSFIHAPNRRRTVSVTRMSDPYWRAAYVGARRIPAVQTEDPATVELSSNN